MPGQGQDKYKKHGFHILGPMVGHTGRKELEFTKRSVIRLENVLHEYEAHT